MKCVTISTVKLDIWPSLACVLCMDFYNFLHAEMTRYIKYSRLCVVCGATVEFVCSDGRTDVTTSVGGLPFSSLALEH
jgi:hypothetical protein